MYSITKCLLETNTNTNTNTIKLSIENKSGKKYYKEINKLDLNVLTLTQLFVLLEKAKLNCLPPDYTINFDLENNQCVMTLCFDNQIIKLDEKQIIPEELDEKSMEINKLKQEISQLKQELYEIKNNSSNEIVLGSFKLESEKPKIIKYNTNEKKITIEVPIGSCGIISWKKLEQFPNLENLTIPESSFFKSTNAFIQLDKSDIQIINTDYCSIKITDLNVFISKITVNPVLGCALVNYLDLPNLKELHLTKAYQQWINRRVITTPCFNLNKIILTFDKNFGIYNVCNEINIFETGICLIFYPPSFDNKPNGVDQKYDDFMCRYIEKFKQNWPNLNSIVYNFYIDIDQIINSQKLEKLENLRTNIKKFKPIAMSYYSKMGLITTFNIYEIASNQYKGLIQKWD